MSNYHCLLHDSKVGYHTHSKYRQIHVRGHYRFLNGAHSYYIGAYPLNHSIFCRCFECWSRYTKVNTRV